MQAKATAKFVRIAPRKARRAIALIRGQHVEEARRILRFSGISASDQVRKALDSAIAAAEQNPGVVTDNLVVSRAYVDEGPTLKRWRPRAMGRATRVRRRTSHITVIVETLGEVTTVGAEG